MQVYYYFESDPLSHHFPPFPLPIHFSFFLASPVGSLGHTQLRDFTFTFHFHELEKEMATHSSVLAWRIPGTGEPGGLPSMGSHRVGHDWSDLAVAVGSLKYWVYCSLVLPPVTQNRCFFASDLWLGLLVSKSSLLIEAISRAIGREGHGSPLQYSRLENPMDGGAW